MAGNEGQLLTTGKAAELLGVTPDTVLRWIRKGRLTAHYTAGGHCRLRLQDLKRFMGVESRDLAPVPTEPPRLPLFCWEYLHPGGGIPEECKSCIVYLARVTWCFRLAEIGWEIGHSKRFCPTSCEECAYFRRVNQLATNVLVISSDRKLISSLTAEPSSSLSLRLACNPYAASAMIQDFRPGFVILDEDIWRGESELVDCLATDPRASRHPDHPGRAKRDPLQCGPENRMHCGRAGETVRSGPSGTGDPQHPRPTASPLSGAGKGGSQRWKLELQSRPGAACFDGCSRRLDRLRGLLPLSRSPLHEPARGF